MKKQGTLSQQGKYYGNQYLHCQNLNKLSQRINRTIQRHQELEPERSRNKQETKKKQHFVVKLSARAAQLKAGAS
jgi:hypothetical protein